MSSSYILIAQIHQFLDAYLRLSVKTSMRLVLHMYHAHLLCIHVFWSPYL